MGQWVEIPESQYKDDSLHSRRVDQEGGWYTISESQYYGASNQRRTQTGTRTVVDQDARNEDVTHKNISFNGWNPSYVSFNGNDIRTVYFNDVKVFWHESVHHDAVTHEEPVYEYEQYRETTYTYYEWVPSSPSISITSASADGTTISVSGRCSVDEKLTVRYINLVWGTHSASIAASNGYWSGTLDVGSDTGTRYLSATVYDSQGQTASDSKSVTVEQKAKYTYGTYSFGDYGSMSGNFYNDAASAAAGENQTYTFRLNIDYYERASNRFAYITNGESIGFASDTTGISKFYSNVSGTVRYKKTKNGSKDHPVGEIVNRTDKFDISVTTMNGDAYVEIINMTWSSRSQNYEIYSTKLEYSDTFTITGKFYSK